MTNYNTVAVSVVDESANHALCLLAILVDTTGVDHWQHFWQLVLTGLWVAPPVQTSQYRITIWRPLLQYGYSYKASFARPG